MARNSSKAAKPAPKVPVKAKGMSILCKGAALVTLLLGIVVPAAVQVLAQAELGQWEMPAGAVAGKTAIVTGANSGLGFETARVLAAGGAEVVMGCRREDRCRAAMEEIRRQHPAAKLMMGLLDLADEKSVRRFAEEFLASHDRLHLLINNAAIMATDFATVEWPGGKVENQFATNHLGPFLLTGLLQGVLEATPGARVVNHSSSASDGCARVKDLGAVAQLSKGNYSAFLDSYACSKRANRYFTWSLSKILAGDVKTVACHPGWTSTNLQHRATGLKASFMSEKVFNAIATSMNAAYAQPLALGAQPQLFAATDRSLRGGEVVGPRFLLFGRPVIETSAFCQLWGYFFSGLQSGQGTGYCEQEDLDALWALSERLSGFTYKQTHTHK